MFIKYGYTHEKIRLIWNLYSIQFDYGVRKQNQETPLISMPEDLALRIQNLSGMSGLSLKM